MDDLTNPPADSTFHLLVSSATYEVEEMVAGEGAVEGSALCHSIPDDGKSCRFDTLSDLIKHFAEGCGLGAPTSGDDWFVTDDGALCCTFMVDVDNVQATDEDMEAWNNGNKRLWRAHLRITVSFARTWAAKEEDLVRLGVRKY